MTIQTDNKIPTRRRRAAKLAALATVPVICLTSLGIGVTAPSGAHATTQPAAHQTATAGEVQPAVSKRFTLYNLTPYQMRLVYFEGPNEGHPPIGETMDIGGQQSFELQYKFLQPTTDSFKYQFLDGNRVVTELSGAASLDPVGLPLSFSLGYKDPHVTSQKSGDTQLYMYGAPGSVMTVPADRKAEVGKVLNTFCAGQHGATCDFTPTSRDPNAMTDWQRVTTLWKNERLDRKPYQEKFTAKHTVAQKTNYEVSASVKVTVAKIFEASIAAKYGHENSESKEYTDEATHTIDYGWKLWADGRFPIIRDTGDFTVKVGSTTFKIVGVIVDSPDPSRHGEISWKAAPIEPGDQGVLVGQDSVADRNS